ncbi:XTP/dITP diphosphatase [Lactiplantibacillus paraplantarum]|uniref:dITP/XTP pyrophosphatase n=1 Tax=Lactiplantibacillus paraplantarum TaxID=60520 RepID=A0ABQ0NEE5_9LACO|nr:XTP/dITP diphosphatase [Lactiplantibacillus paraplantarum]OAX75081.1 non-canonical purine NTP pyrophosphatase [Lactiplantibacillus plantarum]ALO04622.1 non-canonical purine NTP pyrophosphatase [Lactiplantibacillus paraplantarum]AVW10759.1 XTP/dITP diphosphatase [Lactiplantibacillus paraplantarum]ERL42994.1 xanthosine triphosphate pyrophosphatase [Lactiplantibacillus paraplantarum]KGE74026.1 nucleoside-triphosphate diphosphatase [Lactiplantibacillus paraplantarum]
MTKPQTLIIATNNANKAREFSAMLAPYDITIKTLADFQDIPDIKENGITFEENATKKATVVVEATGLPAIADDSGLMVTALHGDPGVFSARYAGDHDDAANNAKLLANLGGVPEAKRTATFHTTLVALKPSGEKLVVNGELAGRILIAPRGNNGFGYDPLFWSSKFQKSLAELTPAQKNQISHRGAALRQLMTKFDEWWAKA